MALKDKLMTLEDFKAVRDVDVASNSAQFTEIKADLDDVNESLDNLDTLTTPPRLDDNTDLNSVTEPGVYTLYAVSAYLNKPTQDAEHGLLEVWHENYGDNAGRFFQRLTYTYKAGRTNSEIWVRSKSASSGAVWTPWVSVSNMSINDVENLLQSQIGIISKIEGSYINLTTDPVSLTPVALASWSHSIVSCAEGDKFIINADGGQMPRAWGFLDSANHVLSVCDASTVVEDLELTAPANAVKLVINDRSGVVSYIVANNITSKLIEIDKSKVNVQQNVAHFGRALVVGRDGKVTTGVLSGGLTDDFKAALLNCFKQVYWDSDNSYNAYLALEAALYSAESRLTALISYGESYVFEDDPLSKVKWLMLVQYDGTDVDRGNYTLSGILTEGKNVLTVQYNNELTAITVDAEAPLKGRNVFTDGDIAKFDGSIETETTGNHKAPYLVDSNSYRSYYTSKGHYPYKDDNDNIVTGKYPIPIPADAVRVRVSVAPNEYEIKSACWRYNNSTFDYSYINLSNTGFIAHKVDTNIAQFENNARALTVTVRKPNGQAFDSLTEPTQVLVQFFDSKGNLLNA